MLHPRRSLIDPARVVDRGGIQEDQRVIHRVMTFDPVEAGTRQFFRREPAGPESVLHGIHREGREIDVDCAAFFHSMLPLS